ncbi:MAG: POTRA domain-containing protein [Candidatus Solibacter sp.]
MKVCLTLLLLAGMALAQTPAKRPPAKKSAAPASAPVKEAPKEAPSKWPVESITVVGNRNYTREQVVAVSGLKIGQLAGKEEFDAARDRLTAAGVFETVGYQFEPGPNKGYAATFQVTEVEPSYPVRFEELGVPDKDLEAMLQSKDSLFSMTRVPATKPVMDRYTAWIQEYLVSKGLKEKIAGKVTLLGTEQFAILFRPARNLPAIAQITFQGNKVIPQTALREAVHLTAVGAPFTESSFRDLLDHAVRPLYEQRGRVRVAFVEIRAEPVSDVEGVHVFVKIDEGQSYSLGKVEIVGVSPIDPAVLIKTGDFKTGDVANFDKINDGMDKIRKAVRRAGYLDAKLTSERSLDDAKKAVNLALQIEPGAQYIAGKLTVTGLDLTGEAEIQRIWTLKEGKTFNPEYPDYFLNRIKEQALFEGLGDTKAETKIDAKTHIVDITLVFKPDDPTKPKRPGPGGDH